MPGISQKKQQQMLAERMLKATHFNRYEIDELIKLYNQTTSSSRFDRVKFRDLLHDQFDMTDDLLMDRVFRAFDNDNDGFLSLEEWIRGLSVFLRGTLQEQIRFCFDVYDFNSDGMIARDEMFALYKKSMSKQSPDEDPDEGIKDLVELALKKMDIDGDHRISFADFTESVQKENLLLQAFGQCLPDENLVQTFDELYLQEPSTSYKLF